MMRFKFLFIAFIAIFLTIGCSSSIDRVIYRPDINQGNYLTDTEVGQLHNGMTKEQVTYLLGTPMLKDPFGDNVWFYVFRQQPGHQPVSQQTLILTFDAKDHLQDIKKEQQ